MVTILKKFDGPVNPALEEIATEINSDYSFDASDNAKDESDGFYLKRPVEPKIAEFFYDKSSMIASSVDIYAEDLILTNKIIATNEEYDLTSLNEMLNKLRLQLSYQIADKRLFGAGCSKIVMFEDNTFTLIQLPQKQLRIKKIKHTDNIHYPIVVQEAPNEKGGVDPKYYKKFDTYYPDDLIQYKNKNFEGFVTWLGESQFYNYYEKPFWLQNIENVSSKIAIEALDRKTFNEGNNANGVFYFNKTGVKKLKPNKPIGEEETDEDDLLLSSILPSNVQVLKAELKQAGTGVAFLYDESDDPMLMNYIKISNDNYQYIKERLDDIDQGIISRSGIPRERYMFNDVKESMNSQKTQAFWEIYTTKLDGAQLEPEEMLKNLINFIYNINVEIDIEVPIFSTIKNEKVQSIKDLFNSALLTLGQALNLINPYITELDLDELDLDDPILNMRFYNGRGLLEFNNSFPDISELGLGDIFGSEQAEV